MESGVLLWVNGVGGRRAGGRERSQLWLIDSLPSALKWKITVEVERKWLGRGKGELEGEDEGGLRQLHPVGSRQVCVVFSCTC